MKRLILSCLLAVTLFSFSAEAGNSEASFTLRFAPEDLSFEKVDGFHRISMKGGICTAEPGYPLIPVRFIQIAVPSELEAVGVEVVSFKHQELPGRFQIWPSQPIVPFSIAAMNQKRVEFVAPDPQVYALSSEYPGTLVKVTNNGFLGGHHLTGVALYPLQYIPAEGKLILYTEIEFKLVFRPTRHPPAPVARRSHKTAEFYSEIVRDVVINPDAVRSLAKGSFGKGDEVDFLIITEDSLVSVFEELADWKIRKGISSKIVTVSWVTSNYGGDDVQEKIRNFILDCYGSYHTKWVLLGGDEEIIPTRHAVVPGMAGPCSLEYVPTDLYYSDLDRTWDENGDGVYGEYPDSIDLYPDVFVGRAPCSDALEAQIFVNKCLAYEAPDSSLGYQKRILYVAQIVGADDEAELKDYIDTAYVPDDWETTKLYESTGTLTIDGLGAALNAGQHIVNHAGHGWFDAIGLGGKYTFWSSSDNDMLSNGPRQSLFYSISCFSAAFDSVDQCFAEHFIHNDSGGGFAYCGNTRYGLGSAGFPAHGPSAEYDKEFFKAMFDSSIFQLGMTFANSKTRLIPLSSDPDTADTLTGTPGKGYRYCMYGLVLLGDPTLELWSDVPDVLVVCHKRCLCVGESYLQVGVNEDDALVTCVQEGQLLGSAYSSGGFAGVHFDSAPDTGTLHVTVTKRNRVPYRGVVQVREDAVEFVAGDANADGLVNLGDLVHLVNFLYKNGCEPWPYEAGDCNCDLLLNIGDVVYLINYLYRGGPAPMRDCRGEFAASRTTTEFKDSDRPGEGSQAAHPLTFSLTQNYPNPFNAETQIRYALPEGCQVKLTIYNVRGQRVRVLVDEFQAAGHNTVMWDGKNQDGHEVASGIYFYRLEAGEFTDTKSMVMLK